MVRLSCKINRLLSLLLLIWSLFVIAVVFWKGHHINYSPWWYIPKWCINLTPGDFIKIVKFWSAEGTLSLRYVLPWMYNFVIYIVPGILLPAVFPQKKYPKYLLYCLAFSVSINVTRLFILRRGSFDIDDIILNLLGFSFGYLILIFAKLLMKRVRRKDMQE